MSSDPGMLGESGIPGPLDIPGLLSQNDLLPEFSSDSVANGSAPAPGPGPSSRELGNDGQGIEPQELRQAVEQNFSSFPSSGFVGLPRRRSRYFIRRSGQRPNPDFIPNAHTLDPMERWQESPPEDEAVPMSAIMDAVKNTPGRRHRTRPNAFRHYRQAPSMTSRESSASSGVSASSDVSNSSSRGSSAQITHKDRKLTRRNPKATDKRRIFCCTFCCDKFKSKYDWARHEKSLHLNPETWYCAPYGATVLSTITGRKHCAFCNEQDPSSEHLESHNPNACQDDPRKPRSFRRKDHLVQHLRLVHHLDTLPLLDDWKIGNTTVPSRCGFCEHSMHTWQERVDHLAGHFRKGSTMADWRGEHEFPTSIAAQVVNALPPYLIGSESQSMVPFSATNEEVRDHFAQISSRAHCTDEKQEPIGGTLEHNLSRSQLSSFTEVLTLHLSRYTQQQMRIGVVPTDEMFQQEARRVLYDSEDSWNQTIADNPEWLSAFRNLHCGQLNDQG